MKTVDEMPLPRLSRPQLDALANLEPDGARLVVECFHHGQIGAARIDGGVPYGGTFVESVTVRALIGHHVLEAVTPPAANPDWRTRVYRVSALGRRVLEAVEKRAERRRAIVAAARHGD
jgi:hypothetical protein